MGYCREKTWLCLIHFMNCLRIISSMVLISEWLCWGGTSLLQPHLPELPSTAQPPGRMYRSRASHMPSSLLPTSCELAPADATSSNSSEASRNCTDSTVFVKEKRNRNAPSHHKIYLHSSINVLCLLFSIQDAVQKWTKGNRFQSSCW